MNSDIHQPTVLCFGEMLWDILPEGRFPGGAPLNVAHQLQRMNIQARLISAVGRDLLGRDLFGWAEKSGLDVSGVGCAEELPTGVVRALVSSDGDASYEIGMPAAWDRIQLSESVRSAAVRADALVFGSLAQRSPSNWTTLDRLLAMLPSAAERVLDVNLRPPHDDLSVVRRLARRATLLKANTAEVARLCEEASTIGREETHARRLAREYQLNTICITAGARGAGLLDYGHWYWEPAAPVLVRDTIGAGDAFLAGLVSARLQGSVPAVTLRQACRIAEAAVSHAGGTFQDGLAPAALEVQQ